MKITSSIEIQTLVHYSNDDLFKLATFRLDEKKVYFQSVFMDLTNYAPSDKITRGIFVDKNTYYVGIIAGT